SEPDQGSLPPKDNPANLYLEVTLESGHARLNGPVAIFMPYPDNDDNGIVDNTDIPEKNLKVNILTGTDWEELPTTVDAGNNIAKGMTDHFTIFGLFGSSAPNLNNVLVYPNPFKPGKGDAALKFLNLTPKATIRIYNVAGELVSIKENITTGAACWDGKNDHGKPVASGGYFYIITDNEDRKKMGKIAVIW
ncbi:gliding motility-associated C-terminal domain-containing protein, partial [bacterium]|nr:gliding motility-associated C-terminal domain-containing protein [bacterium]